MKNSKISFSRKITFSQFLKCGFFFQEGSFHSKSYPIKILHTLYKSAIYALQGDMFIFLIEPLLFEWRYHTLLHLWKNNVYFTSIDQISPKI